MKTHLLAMALSLVTVTTLIVIIACGGEAPPPPPPNAGASGGAQCGKDSDCKGDRVCDHGQCVSPR